MARQRKTSKNLGKAREHRGNPTVPEKKIWDVLRDRRLAGLKFRRQVPVENYIVDYACIEHRLIIEVDGDSHAERYSQDANREGILREARWTVLRVTNDDVLTNLEGVLMQIIAAAELDPVAWRDGAYGQLPEGSF